MGLFFSYDAVIKHIYCHVHLLLLLSRNVRSRSCASSSNIIVSFKKFIWRKEYLHGPKKSMFEMDDGALAAIKIKVQVHSNKRV